MPDEIVVDVAPLVRRRFFNPGDPCTCRPTKCEHSFYWPTEGVVEHRPQAVVEVSMPADQPCPIGLVEITEPADADGEFSEVTTDSAVVENTSRRSATRK